MTPPPGQAPRLGMSWTLLTLVLLALAGLLGVDRYTAYRAVLTAEARRLTNQTDIVAANLSQRLQATANALDSVRDWFPRLAALPEGKQLSNQRLQAMVDAMVGVRTFLIVDGAGDTLASNRKELLGMNWRGQERYPTISQDADPDKLYLSPPFKTPLGIWAQSIGKMLPDARGQFAGYALAILDPAYFSLLLDSVRYAPDLHAAVIHGDGKVVLRVPDAEGRIGEDLSAAPDSPFLEHRRGGQDLTVFAASPQPAGADLMSVYRTLWPEGVRVDLPLVAAVSRDRAAILAAWRDETTVRATLFGGIALVAVLGLTATRRRQRAYAQLLAVQETERRQSERLLKESERRWKLATEGAELGIWYWDPAAQQLDWSALCREHLALPPDAEPSFAHFYAVMHPDDRARVEGLIQAAVDAVDEYRAEYRILHPDGQLRWISAPGRVYRDVAGALVGMGGITRDITARKQAEINLQESERRFRDLFEHLPIAYQSLDAAGRWLDANAKTAELLGYDSPAQMIGRDFVAHWDAAMRARFDANFEAFKLSHSIDGELPLRRRDGAPVAVMVSGRIQRDADGNFLRTHCVLFDISERRAMEDEIRALNADLERKVEGRTAELRDSEARARAFMNTAQDGVLVIDRDSRILEFNPAAETLFGYRAAEILGQPLARLMPPQEGTRHAHYVNSSTARSVRLMGGNRQVLGRTKEGHDFPVAVSVGTLGDGAGRLHVGIIRDITQQLAQETALSTAKEAAEAAARAKSEFLAHMSHEIRTPMNAVLGLAQLLKREPLSADQRDMVERIQGAGRSLLAIINDILDFSKIEAGQLRLEARPFRLETLTAQIDSLLGATARAKGIGLSLVLPEAPLGPLLGDAQRLEQVLINLIGNAIKFSDQGEVAILIQPLHLSDTEVRLRFEVRDTGIGISPAAQARLFEPFTQAENGISRRFGGTGLGLSISKRLVELMGGTIGVDSQPGQGSTFWFELPLARASEAEEASPAAPVAAPTGPRLQGQRLLAVDDSAMNRDLVERVLNLEGARVTLAADGQQAVQYLHSTAPGFDAVLMDVRMPVMDGLTAIRLIRQELGLTDLPILALTAGVLAEEQQAARDAGANEVLAKPLDLDLLATRLVHHIGAARLAAAAAVPAVETEEGHSATSPAVSAGGDDALPPGGVGLGRGGEAGPNAFPAIPGIDPDRVALTFKDDVDFFLSLLHRLNQEAAAGLIQARQALASGDRETATRCLHSLKGNAGNVGALTLMAAAGQLETALQAGVTDLESGLADLERQVADLTAASAPWRPASAREPEAAAKDTPAPPPDEQQLAALRDALRRQRLQARQLFKELEAGLVAAHGQEQILPLVEALNALRFDDALDLLAQVAPEAPPTAPSDPSTTPGAREPV